MSARPRVVWLVWDAAAHWVVSRLMEEGALPALSTLAREGVYAPARVSGPAAQTPPALATLFTGAPPERHGIVGFRLPDPSRGALGVRSGFEREALRVAPVWERVGPACGTALANAPWTDFERAAPRGCRFGVDGFSRRIARGGVAVVDGRTEVAIGGRPAVVSRSGGALELAAGDVPGPPTAAPAAAAPAAAGGPGPPATLEIDAPAWTPWPADAPDGVLARALTRPADGATLLAFTGAWRAAAWAPARDGRRLAGALGPFVGEGLGRAYRFGAFGPRIAEDGDGSAEELLLETVGLATDYFDRCCLAALEHGAGAGLTVAYQPSLDDVEHELIGWCDAESAAHRPDLADRATALLRRAHERLDDQLARVLERAGDDATVIVSSDHGMAGTAYVAHLNEVLASAGLLEFADDGTIDAARSPVVCSPAGDGSVWVQTDDRPGGWVDAARREDYAGAAARALLACRAPDGSPVVLEASPPGDGWYGADLHALVAPGFQLDMGRSPTGAAVVPSVKTGGHLHDPGDERFLGIFAARGPGVERLGDPGVVENRDVAARVTELLGIAAEPADRLAAGARA
ncbi:MAG TPA: alkaline phosphatase family protein [Thermoleophilaceae bacterium]